MNMASCVCVSSGDDGGYLFSGIGTTLNSAYLDNSLRITFLDGRCGMMQHQQCPRSRTQPPPLNTNVLPSLHLLTSQTFRFPIASS